MRTCFATLGIAGVTHAWQQWADLSLYLIILLMIGSTAVGMYRYFRVKTFIYLEKLPNKLDRAPLWPIVSIVVLSVTTVAVAAFAHGIEK